MRSALTVSLVLTGLLACGGGIPRTGTPLPAPTQATEVAGESSAQSASLMRRLAEAADGYRDGKPHWVVIHRKGDRGHHDVKGVFDSLETANVAAQRAGPEYAVFGPFVTTEDPPATSYGGEEVDYVIVVQKDGVKKQFDGDSVDALFWSMAAFDKFIAPYLTTVDGVRYAAEQRELYRIAKSPLVHSALVAHKAGSF